jgi:hypothetical protein
MAAIVLPSIGETIASVLPDSAPVSLPSIMACTGRDRQFFCVGDLPLLAFQHGVCSGHMFVSTAQTNQRRILGRLEHHRISGNQSRAEVRRGGAEKLVP